MGELPGGLVVKSLHCNAGSGFDPWEGCREGIVMEFGICHVHTDIFKVDNQQGIYCRAHRTLLSNERAAWLGGSLGRMDKCSMYG